MSHYEVRENTLGLGYVPSSPESPPDVPKFLILKDGLPVSGGHSRDFCERAIAWFQMADSVTEKAK